MRFRPICVLFCVVPRKVRQPNAAGGSPASRLIAPSRAPRVQPGLRSSAARCSGRREERRALRYLLEGIEIVGNTKTRRRVVEHYVPFRRGDVWTSTTRRSS